MHGVLAKDLKNLKKEKFITWRVDNSTSINEEYKYFFSSQNFRETTGMSLRDGLPVFNIRSHKNFNSNSFFLTLPESLLSINGEWNGKISKSIAASSGLYDIYKNKWIKKIEKKSNILLPQVNSNIKTSYGFIKFSNKSIPVFGCGEISRRVSFNTNV